MDEKYLITLYEKIPITQNTMLFKKNRIVEEAYIDLKNEFEEATFYDDNNQRIKVESMYNPYTIVSDDKYCYNYPITIEQIKKIYPNIIDKNELAKKYDEEIDNVFEIAYYDKNNDKVKIFTTNEEVLKEKDTEDLFKEFLLNFDSTDDESITIKKNDISRMIKMLNNKKSKELKQQLERFDNSVNISIGLVQSIFEVGKVESAVQKKETDKELLEDVLKELNDLIGLENIKKEVNKLIKYLLYREKTKKYLKLEQPNLHMLFTGNPGTGKTTVARIIGKILYKLGYLETDKFVEITPKSLIAEYVGQTAIKTAKLIAKNKGGVIFIDEAYVLASEHQGFGKEALVEILKELEKQETMFIFAGYKDEMKKFMELNPGLTSRVGYYLEYNDYTKEELYQIFENKVSNMGFKIDDQLKQKLIEALEEARQEKNFGNGRYIDKLINKIILQHAFNTENNKRKDKLITLTEKDFTPDTEESLIYKTKVKKIGF